MQMRLGQIGLQDQAIQGGPKSGYPVLFLG